MNNPKTIPPGLGRSRLFPATSSLSRWPWWALVAALIGVLFVSTIITNETYGTIFGVVSEGVAITVFVTIVSYAIAVVLGLLLAFGRVSSNFIAYQVSTFIVEIIRGVPMLVLLLYIAFVVMDEVVKGSNAIGAQMQNAGIFPFIGDALANWKLRDVPNLTRVIVALAIAYSAFIAEIFRAGIESIERGQIEAGRALGMSYWQTMQYVIMPQAIRTVLPPLGNDFISMLKDSSLVSVLGVLDITEQGKLYASKSFQTFEPYNVMAFMYLVMTLLLSMVVRWVERQMAHERRQQ